MFKVLFTGIVIRLCLFGSGLHAYLSQSPLFSTPISSIEAVKEGIYLQGIGASPYDSDYFHGSPILLFILKPFLAIQILSIMFFIVSDTVVALLLFRISERIQSKWENEIKTERAILASIDIDRETKINSYGKKDTRNSLLLSPKDISKEKLASIVMAVYYLNPFTVCSCVAMNINVVAQVPVCASLYCVISSYSVLGMLFLSLAIHFQGYPAVLMFPYLILIRKMDERVGLFKTALFCCCPLIFGYGLLKVAQNMTSDLSTYDLVYYGFVRMLNVPDLRPNLGVWWYFFLEIFDRFRDFFVFVFHMHPFVLMVPLILQFGHRPLLLANMLLCMFSVFKPYPDFSDVAFAFSMLSLHPMILEKVEHLALFGAGIIIPSCLLPLMWHMWLVTGTGNANFYFFQALILQLFLVQLLTHVIRASLQADRNILSWKARKKDE